METRAARKNEREKERESEKNDEYEWRRENANDELRDLIMVENIRKLIRINNHIIKHWLNWYENGAETKKKKRKYKTKTKKIIHITHKIF